MSPVSRRLVAAGLPAAALAGRAMAQGSAQPRTVQGLTTYSESAMVMSVSADGSSALTLRICRFPEVNLTWLWCHILRDGRGRDERLDHRAGHLRGGNRPESLSHS